MARLYSKLCLLLVAVALVCAPGHGADGPAPLADEQRSDLQKVLASLQKALAGVQRSKAATDHYADAAVFVKAVAWALRFDKTFTAADVALLKKGLTRARNRMDALVKGNPSWAVKKGRVARGFAHGDHPA